MPLKYEEKNLLIDKKFSDLIRAVTYITETLFTKIHPLKTLSHCESLNLMIKKQGAYFRFYRSVLVFF